MIWFNLAIDYDVDYNDARQVNFEKNPFIIVFNFNDSGICFCRQV